MSKIYEFLKECGHFYVLTINGDFPAGRPFGAVMEYDGKLYISTNNENQVHKQLRENGNVQILAKKERTREWLRITGKSTECVDINMKKKMLEECPVLSKRFLSAEEEKYLLFQVEVLNTEFH
ncbi:pyridoxamine 5'-phosphate oxidase family protein [Agathobaculum ammoniilyticum]|uniref:Pyridoxamine 5'-phosphate oxidase family protein n=1 Tax=Agathobaculum ammoniilyticum TaxID=2981778 RepID=A0ABT2U954_9FIRM|nr:pyridoxamine 5'-phosphate oxidase family protein [Agathobaculum ammoniilyticum]MCU6790452.1 pyridoxamine 5'-phosphate oxidase family protein [Agathobaculum ammoniilyticum]